MASVSWCQLPDEAKTALEGRIPSTDEYNHTP